VLLGLSAPALLLVLVTMLAPVTWLFGLSFLDDAGGLSLEHYRRMIEQPSYGRTFLVTFQVSLLTTAICIATGYPLAYTMSQLPARVANLCLIAVLLPFWTSLLVRTYAWLVLLQRKGLINEWGIALGWWDEPLALVHNLTGTLIGMVHIMLPFLVLPLLGAMRAIDTDYQKAAASLGASPVRAFWSVFFPLSMPGLPNPHQYSLASLSRCIGLTFPSSRPAPGCALRGRLMSHVRRLKHTSSHARGSQRPSHCPVHAAGLGLRVGQAHPIHAGT
jgi:ABC-type spermidine/putrescine transport system permease subunit I